ncbi:spore germination protein [Salinithrix halophila]|uniref:Spore germination protein n=1 Tax=Salinithrix halophila TaxID=1485204 RepID=A0ABV8JGJ4_9BACL
MGTINNLKDVKIQEITSAGAVGYGNTINVNPTQNIKSEGVMVSLGDYQRGYYRSKNFYNDRDLSDQNRTP